MNSETNTRRGRFIGGGACDAGETESTQIRSLFRTLSSGHAALLALLLFFVRLQLGHGSVAGKGLLSSVNLIICVLERKLARLNKAGTDETHDLSTFFRPPLNQEVGQEVEV